MRKWIIRLAAGAGFLAIVLLLWQLDLGSWKPLDLEKINKDTPLEFYVTDNWEISNTDINAANLNNIDWLSDTPFQLRGHAIHKSRVIVFRGKEFPPLYRPIGRGWGMSILEPLVRTLNKSIKNATQSIIIFPPINILLNLAKLFNSYFIIT